MTSTEDLKFNLTPPDDIEEWRKKLLDKTFVANDEEMDTASTNQTFKRTELPEGCRVVPPGAPMTRDYIPSRLNVLLDSENRVTQVYYG